MTSNATLPSVGYSEIDNSGVLPVNINGVHALITPTLMGPADQPYEIKSLTDFQNQFGGADTVRSPFYPQIKRFLQRGGNLWVQRLLAPGATQAALPVGAPAWLTAAAEFTIQAKDFGSFANGALGVNFVSGAANGGLWGLQTVFPANPALNETFVTPAGGTLTALLAMVNTYSNLITVTVTGTPVDPGSTTATQFMATGTDGTWTTGTPDPKTLAANALLGNFTDITPIDTISALGIYTEAWAQDLITYAESRKDLIGIFEIDPSITPAAALALLTGSLAGVNDTYLAVYYSTFLTGYNSDLGLNVAGPCLMDVLGVFCYSDTIGARYQAPAGSKRGLIPNVTSFATNLLSPARASVANALVAAGCNIVGSHPSFGPVVWGASTFNKGVSAAGPAGTVSALNAIHVRRMLIDLHADLQPLFQSELFDPQDPASWRAMYGKAKPILTLLEKQNAIYPGWNYIGDQAASTIQDATFNSPANLAIGIYNVLIQLVPVGFISQINFTAQVNSLLSMFNTAVAPQSGSMPSAT